MSDAPSHENAGPLRSEVQTQLDSIVGTTQDKIDGLIAWLDSLGYGTVYIGEKTVKQLILSDVESYVL